MQWFHLQCNESLNMSVFCKKLLRFLLHAQYNSFSNPIHKEQWILIEKKVATDGCVISDDFHKFFSLFCHFYPLFRYLKSWIMYRKLYSSSKYLKLCSESIICTLQAVIYSEIMGFGDFSAIFCDFWPFLSTYEPEMISNARTGLLKQSFQHLTPFNPLKSPKKSFIDEKSDGLTRNSGLRGQILVFRSFLASNFPKMYIFEKFLRILFFYIK